MDRTYGSNKANRTDGTGAIRPRPTTMERNNTTFETNYNGIILAITNTTHNHDNRKLPTKLKQK